MNKEMLAKCQGHLVRIRPVARRFQGQDELQPLDDDWRIVRVDLARKVVEIHDIRCDHCPTLGLDHIHSYTSDPMRDIDGQKHGFLQLNVQVLLTDRGPQIEPLPPNYRRDEVLESDARPTLSVAARELLLQAAEDPSGVVMRLGTLDGTFVKTNGRNFVEPGSARSAAQWRGAVDELHRLGFVEDRAGKGEVFFVTASGYATADMFRRPRLIPALSVLR